MASNKTDLHRFTRLPLEVINKLDGVSPTIIVKTPMGQKSIEMKKTHYPFLFGSVTETEKSLPEIITVLKDLEQKSIDYLFKGWLLKENNNVKE